MAFFAVRTLPIETGKTPYTPIETNLPTGNDYMVYLRSSGSAVDLGHSIKLAGATAFYSRPGSLDDAGLVDAIATGAPGAADELYYAFGVDPVTDGEVLFDVALGEPAQVNPTKISGVVRVNGALASRVVKAFEYNKSTFKLQGRDLDTSKPLGEAVSDPETGEYTIMIASGFTGSAFVVVFDDLGRLFAPGEAVSIGDRIRPTEANGYIYVCKADGTLPATEPAEWSQNTEEDVLVGTASFRPTPLYRPMVNGPVTPEIADEIVVDPFFSSVVSLLHFDGDSTDVTGRVWSENGAVIAAETGGKFDGKLILDGGYMTTPYTADFDWFATDYTIECWINPSSLSSFERSDNCTLIGRMTPNSGLADWSFGPHADGSVRFIYWNGSAQVIAIGPAITEGLWAHIAAVVRQGEIQVFVNGVGGTPVSITGTPSASPGVNIVVGKYNGRAASGSVDDLRITKGVARYTGNFTPPAQAFPDQGPDWTPAQLVTALWLDAADSDTITFDQSGNVDLWLDKSGNERNFSQAASSARPEYIAESLNGNPAVFFDTSKYLERANGWVSGTSHTVIAVLDPPASGDRKYLLSAGVTESSGEGNEPLLLFSLRNNNEDLGFFDGTAWQGTAPATTGPQILGFVLNGGGSAETFRDGASLEAAIPYAGNDFDPARRVVLGARVGAVDNWSGAKISELIKIDGVISVSDRQKVEGYLAHKWGLAGSLPSNHPYKSEAP